MLNVKSARMIKLSKIISVLLDLTRIYYLSPVNRLSMFAHFNSLSITINVKMIVRILFIRINVWVLVHLLCLNTKNSVLIIVKIMRRTKIKYYFIVKMWKAIRRITILVKLVIHMTIFIFVMDLFRKILIIVIPA